VKAVAFPRNSNPHILGIPAGDELHSVLNKYSLPSSSLACGLSSPAFIGDNGRIELSSLINFFVGDQPIIQREMEGSDEGEVSWKEVKDTVLLLAKQMVELKAVMNWREEIASNSSEYPISPPSVFQAQRSSLELGGIPEVVKPLTVLTSPKVKWAWNDAQQQEFDNIKQKVGMSPISTNPVTSTCCPSSMPTG